MSTTEAAGAASVDAQGLLARVGDDLAAVAGVPVGARTGDAGERIETLHRLRAAVDAQLLAELGGFETCGGHQVAGCKSVGSWVRLHLRQSHTGAGHTVGLARALPGLPVAAAALADGAITVEHVE
ncbi:MAG TPA: DUF222 domain-containing protein, partial [Nocardioidaceae bacterium]|nr:DUF222 domain-containing protein [Nocardioidaceae bacterium]